MIAAALILLAIVAMIGLAYMDDFLPWDPSEQNERERST